jgi:hypothetical protein
MNFSPPPNGQNNDFASSRAQDKDFSDIPYERRIAAQNQARKWFLILMGSGLIIGMIVAFGVVQVLTKLGLDNKPNYQIQIEVNQDKPSPSP